jgi:hypothetical protein
MAGRQWQRDPAKERFWRQMVRRWARSGLSIREFCDRETISEGSFYAWRRELAKRDRQAAEAQGAERSARDTGTPPPGDSRFVPVHVIADLPVGLPLASRVEVLLASGSRMWIPCGVDRQTLADVVSVLEQRPC